MNDQIALRLHAVRDTAHLLVEAAKHLLQELRSRDGFLGGGGRVGDTSDAATKFGAFAAGDADGGPGEEKERSGKDESRKLHDG